MTSRKGNSDRIAPKTSVVLGLVPVTMTLWACRSEERFLWLNAVGICEVYATPLTSLPLTAPVSLNVSDLEPNPPGRMSSRASSTMPAGTIQLRQPGRGEGLGGAVGRDG